MSITKLSPSAADFYTSLGDVIGKIQQGDRVQVLVPREISHNGPCQRSEELEGIQMDFRDSVPNPNIFVVLRYDLIDEAGDVFIDVCHF